MQLLERIESDRITVVEIVPSYLRELVDEIARRPAPPDLLSWRFLIATGEALPPALCREWLTAHPDIPLVNAWGPTECSDDVTHHFVRRPPAASVVNMPIGRPVANMRAHVLDSTMRLVPIGVRGELYAGGIGVGRGYLNRSDWTAESFVPDPYDRPGARLYKTGDLARHLDDGTIEFNGRIDYQVKVRGFRVETGEIENALRQVSAVKHCVVQAVDGASGSGGKRRRLCGR